MFFFFNDTATTEIYTLSLHDALPISSLVPLAIAGCPNTKGFWPLTQAEQVMLPEPTTVVITPDRKSTRLNSSHTVISYAVFCLKKKINRLAGVKSSSS